MFILICYSDFQLVQREDRSFCKLQGLVDASEFSTGAKRSIVQRSQEAQNCLSRNNISECLFVLENVSAISVSKFSISWKKRNLAVEKRVRAQRSGMSVCAGYRDTRAVYCFSVQCISPRKQTSSCLWRKELFLPVHSVVARRCAFVIKILFIQLFFVSHRMRRKICGTARTSTYEQS